MIVEVDSAAHVHYRLTYTCAVFHVAVLDHYAPQLCILQLSLHLACLLVKLLARDNRDFLGDPDECIFLGRFRQKHYLLAEC